MQYSSLYQEMPDGTIKQVNAFSGTEVWSVPGRGIKPRANARKRHAREIKDLQTKEEQLSDITDRIADLLRAEGLRHSLIDLGEFRALSSHPSGRPWKVGVKDPHESDSLLTKVDLTDRALATSATTGTRFDRLGRHHHLFDPSSGRPSRGLVSASVIARRARDADAFSTALLASPEPLAAENAAHMGVERVLTVDAAGALGEWHPMASSGLNSVS